MNIRPATPADSTDLAHIHVEGWRSSYGGLVDQGYLDGLDKNAREKDWLRWMAEGTEAMIAHDDDGTPAGFISFGKLMSPPPGMSPIRPLYSSEIMAIYILPDYWRKGLGRNLMARAATRLQEKKHRSVCLWVLEKNSRGVGFYKSLGGERCGKKTVNIGGRDLTDICYGWRNITALTP